MGALPLPFEQHPSTDPAARDAVGSAVLLGAGFSKWSVGLPLASELFDFDVHVWGPRDHRKLQILDALEQYWGERHPGSTAEEFVAYGLGQSRTQREAVLWYIGRRLCEPFVRRSLLLRRERRYVLMIDDKAKLDVPGMEEARRFLHRLCALVTPGIVTTNYDMVVEYALGSRAFNYGELGERLLGSGPYPLSQWKYPLMLRGRVPLAKLHGSVSWDQHGCYVDGRRGITGRALIVAPTPEKRPPSQLRHVWKLAERILSDARRLLVFGFAFNPYDTAVLELLRAAGQNLRHVLLVDIRPPIQPARDLWPYAVVTATQPTPNGLKDAEDWWGCGPPQAALTTT